MKKFLVLLIIATMMLSLVACGGPSDTDESTEYTTEVEEIIETDEDEDTTEAEKTTETEESTTEEVTTEEITTEELTTEEETTEEITTEEVATEETTTEPEFDFSGAASPKLAEIAQKIASSDEYLIFTIGDSVTEGQGATKTTDYTAMFSKKLGEIFTGKSIYRVDGAPNSSYTGVVYPGNAATVQTGTDGEITVARCGVGGDTVARVLNRTGDFINKEIRGKTGDLFTICLGINESWAGTPKYAAPTTYKRQLEELVDAIYAAHPDADIILMTPTFVGDNPRQLDLYAKAVKQLAAARDIAYIDLNAMWTEHYDKNADHYGQGDWLVDNCHPTEIGYEAIADEMIRWIFGVN